MVPSDRTRTKGHQLKHKFHLDVRQNCFIRSGKALDRLPRDVAPSPDTFLCHLLQTTLPWQRGWAGLSPGSLPTPIILGTSLKNGEKSRLLQGGLTRKATRNATGKDRASTGRGERVPKGAELEAPAGIGGNPCPPPQGSPGDQHSEASHAPAPSPQPLRPWGSGSAPAPRLRGSRARRPPRSRAGAGGGGGKRGGGGTWCFTSLSRNDVIAPRRERDAPGQSVARLVAGEGAARASQHEVCTRAAARAGQAPPLPCRGARRAGEEGGRRARWKPRWRRVRERGAGPAPSGAVAAVPPRPAPAAPRPPRARDSAGRPRTTPGEGRRPRAPSPAAPIVCPAPARPPPAAAGGAPARNMTSIHFVVHPLPGTEDQLNDRWGGAEGRGPPGARGGAPGQRGRPDPPRAAVPPGPGASRSARPLPAAAAANLAPRGAGGRDLRRGPVAGSGRPGKSRRPAEEVGVPGDPRPRKWVPGDPWRSSENVSVSIRDGARQTMRVGDRGVWEREWRERG